MIEFNIGNLDVNNVTNVRYMFESTFSFNQPIEDCNVSNVKKALYIFYKCSIKEEYKPKST